MPRDLSEVLHYFMPELDAPDARGLDRKRAGAKAAVAPGGADARVRGGAPAPSSVLPIVAVPIGDRDVVRAAFTWNLSIEVARLGARSALVTPGWDEPSPLWPEPAGAPFGAELIRARAQDLGALYRVAIDTAVERADGARDGGAVFVRVPPAWLRSPGEGAAILRWSLLFTSSHAHDLLETYGLGKLILAAAEDAEVGVTIHGARTRCEAEGAFARLASVTRSQLDRDVLSYGLLVDDLDVYRAIVAQRPIGLAHPQSAAARALRDVARMLLDDARKRALA